MVLSLLTPILTLGLTTLHSQAVAQPREGEPFRPRFYAFQNGVQFGSAAKDAQTLRELGYDGVSQVFRGGAKLAETVAAYEKVQLKVLSIYLNVDDEPIKAEVVKALADRDGMIELTVRKMTPKTVEAVRQTAEMARQLKIRVALYPHHGFAISTMPQAMALIEKVDHPNLGVMFNLCHFLRGEPEGDLEAVLEKAGSRLFAVSTCGADLGGQGWGELIQRLDQGNFPQQRLFRVLKKLKFSGPVGLQCYNLRGDKRANLQQSIRAWQEILNNLD